MEKQLILLQAVKKRIRSYLSILKIIFHLIS
nr:MAG TPA: hypothetical protein [Caudoviricetes sp.]DAZ38272.1 MAG TPA: hypothetical protein [Caudoviricetes sp.]